MLQRDLRKRWLFLSLKLFFSCPLALMTCRILAILAVPCSVFLGCLLLLRCTGFVSLAMLAFLSPLSLVGHAAFAVHVCFFLFSFLFGMIPHGCWERLLS